MSVFSCFSMKKKTKIDEVEQKTKKTPHDRRAFPPEVTKHYTIDSVIANTAVWGKVYLLTDRRVYKKAVLKITSRCGRLATPEDPQRERYIYRCLQETKDEHHKGSKRILRMMSDGEYNAFQWMVLEWANRGDAFVYVKTFGGLPPTLCRRFFTDLVFAMDYIHSRGFAHRDVSLENCFLFDSPEESRCLKVGDFGCASKSELTTQRAAKTAYGPPENICRQIKPYDPQQADVWSMGIVLFMLLTGEALFTCARTKCSRYRFFRTHGLQALLAATGVASRFKRCPGFPFQLLKWMLSINPQNRPTTKDILGHTFCALQNT